jgi:membrane protein DedA with SNARE-associated domain
MPTPRFMVFNALGAVAWTVFFGVGGYLFGTFFEAVGRPLGIGALVLAVAVVAGLIVYVHRHAAALQAKADAMFGV